ncbi:unnamed protein product [Schistosoma guineensis]|nr:unnamed protein product [Schistosoma guineensis]
MIHSLLYIYIHVHLLLFTRLSNSFIRLSALWSELSANKTVVADSLRLLISNTVEVYIITVTMVIA